MESALTTRGQQARDQLMGSYHELAHTTGLVRHADLHSRGQELFRAFGRFWGTYWGAFPNTEANIRCAEIFAESTRELLQTKYKYDAYDSFMRRLRRADVGNLCLRHMPDSPAHHKWAADSLLSAPPLHECSQRCYKVEGKCVHNISLYWLWTQYRSEQESFRAWLRAGVSGQAYTPQPRHPWSDFFRDFADYQNGLCPGNPEPLSPWRVSHVVYETWVRVSGHPRLMRDFALFGEQKYVAQVHCDMNNLRDRIANVNMPQQLQDHLYARVSSFAIAMEKYMCNPRSSWAPYWEVQKQRMDSHVHQELSPFPSLVCDIAKIDTQVFVVGGKAMVMCYIGAEVEDGEEGMYVEIGSEEECEHLQEVATRNKAARIERWVDTCLAAGCGAPDEDEALWSDESESGASEDGAAEAVTPEDGAPENDAPQSDAPESEASESEASESEASESEARDIDMDSADDESDLDEAGLYEDVYDKTYRGRRRAIRRSKGRCRKWETKPKDSKNTRCSGFRM